MRVAIVHDYLIQLGGAERVLSSLLELFPHASVFTLLYNPATVTVPALTDHRIHTSFLQRIPGAQKHHRYFPMLMPLAVEQFDTSEYDVVISDTHSFSKGIITSPRTLHISYCFTPTRYVWDDCHRYVREFSHLVGWKKLAPLGLSYIRRWDYFASQRVDSYLTLSQFVAQRIQKYYHRHAEVIPPPVDVDRFTVADDDHGYYLVVSRLLPYKRVDLAIEACQRLGRHLKIVGTGPEEESLKQHAGSHVEFLGFVPDHQLPALYAGARALIFPQEEDFGITPLEAAATGKPTIAYAAGGAVETIEEEVTGVFFREQTTDALMRAMIRFEHRAFSVAAIRYHAERFRRERFIATMRQAVETKWDAWQHHHQTRPSYAHHT